MVPGLKNDGRAYTSDHDHRRDYHQKCPAAHAKDVHKDAIGVGFEEKGPNANIGKNEPGDCEQDSMNFLVVVEVETSI